MSTPSDHDYAKVFISGGALASFDRIYDELLFKLGLPENHERTWAALQKSLSTLGDTKNAACAHWQLRAGERMVLQVHGFSPQAAHPQILMALAETVAAANYRLQEADKDIRIWLEFINGGT